MNFELSDENRLIRETIRDIAQNVIAPNAKHVDETGEFPYENFKALADAGFMGLVYPEEYGGAGADTVAYVIATEAISAACGSTGLTYAAHISLACAPLYYYGTEAQKQSYLTRLTSGESFAGFGLTEPQTGSDAAGLRTRAVRDGEDWIINGQKMWITSGGIGDWVIVAAVSDPDKGSKGITNLIVERGDAGYVIGKNEPKMGLKGSVTSSLFFEEVRVPDSRRVGDVGQGFIQFMKTLDGGRISIGAMALGLGQAALDHSIAYAKERVAFGQEIANFQAIQNKLADMAMELEAARLMLYQAAALKDAGKPFGKQAAMAKLFASEAAERATFQAIQIHGGMGYSREYPVERLYRDNRLTEIGEGTSEIMRLVIARQVLRES
ncbi:MAG: acyl-CoA dehydrogenase family protein [Anaerolineales bacterium]|nr:acyl-CoA dehydrogenase family protein [Anaerolineales bacterium]MCB9128801.1 acyl-CoA dehydrogenase family protein [Ardenticatenales bacterium]MCB9171365.1 acyl-CoA dehydrogenase family protein [Ardenticatenales bacterium]